MQKIEFTFHMKPPSLNSLYVTNPKTGRRFPSKEGGIWKKYVSETLSHLRAEIFEFETNVSIYENCLRGEILIEVPMCDLMTKKGYLSKKFGDVANREKVVFDAIFKEFDKLDDVMLTPVLLEKIPSRDNEYHTHVSLYKENLDDLLNRVKQ